MLNQFSTLIFEKGNDIIFITIKKGLMGNMKYALHDTEINKIVCNNKGIEIYFEKGVYLLNDDRKEIVLSKPCRIVITVSSFDATKLYEHITVRKLRKSKVAEMPFTDFLEYLEKYPFCVDIDYYSFFAASIMLKGYCGKYVFELTITEVEKAEYIFDEIQS